VHARRWQALLVCLVVVLSLAVAGVAFASNGQLSSGAPNGIVVVPGNTQYSSVVGPNFSPIPSLIGYMNVPPNQTSLFLLRFSGFGQCHIVTGPLAGAGCELQIWLDGQPVGPVLDNRIFHLESGQTSTSGTFSVERAAPAVGPGKHTITVALAAEQTAGCTAACGQYIRLEMPNWVLTIERFRSS
jgi:hypothetical protein